ncbi:hypothetical protein LCGC14_2684080, partial [marine sediment metagenome]
MGEMTDQYNKRLMKKLRQALWFIEKEDVSDERVWEIMKGTFAEARARVEIIKEDMAECFNPVLD